MINKQFLAVLACPLCKGSLEYSEGSDHLNCHACERTFKLSNGIPELVTEPIELPVPKKDTKNEDVFPSSVVYHLSELEIAKDASHPKNIMPSINPEHRAILDIGCGLGQTFVASGIHEDENRLLIGLDIDYDPMLYGKQHFPNINFINGVGDNLPLATESMDFILSRVSLLYTNIPVAISEIERVLKPGGEIWITLNPVNKQMQLLVTAIKRASIKGIIARSYVMLNGIILHFFGKLIPLPFKGSYESFQSKRAMTTLLKKHGFEDVKIEVNEHFLITARKGSPDS